MRFIANKYCISIAFLCTALCHTSLGLADEEANKRPTKLIQNLLSESEGFAALEIKDLAGDFIQNREVVQRLPVQEVESLFQKVERNVYKIIVLEDSPSQVQKIIGTGSAVAINSHTLVTNCHVIASPKVYARIDNQGTQKLLNLKKVTMNY